MDEAEEIAARTVNKERARAGGPSIGSSEEAKDLNVKGRSRMNKADLLYHSLVLMASRGLTLDDVRAELRRRRHGR